ncbi:MAG: hypothetical protein JSV63_00805 [Candidatus Aenigmatarchaeota archaeon]|nr:MAG: hypothetical protein JSV63_00805 [Candidatus Aenigmarchaeota archaeon]
MSANSYLGRNIKRRDFVKTMAGAAGAMAFGMSCSEPPYELRSEVDPKTGTSYDVISNPLGPLYEGGGISKEVEIGECALTGGDENYIFDRLRDVFLRDGAIYVADRGRSIRVFDLDGSHQVTFGRRGQGPKEFSSDITGLYVDNDGLLYVCEKNGTLSIFDNNYDPLGRRRNIKSLVEGLIDIPDFASFDPEDYLHHCAFRVAVQGYDNTKEDLFYRLRLNATEENPSFSFGQNPNMGVTRFKEAMESLKGAAPTGGYMDYDAFFDIELSYENMFLDTEAEIVCSSARALPSRIVFRSAKDGRISRIIERNIDENVPFYIIRESDLNPMERLNEPEMSFHTFRVNNDVQRLHYFGEESMGLSADGRKLYSVYKTRTEWDSPQYFMDVFDMETGTHEQRVPLDLEVGSNFAGMDREGNMVFFRGDIHRDNCPVVERYRLHGLE